MKTASFGKLQLEMFPGRILVQIDSFAYGGKIVIPDAVKRPPTTGVVLACGENVTKCAVGDRVLYGVYSGTAVKFKQTPLARILVEDEVLCKILGEAELESYDGSQG